MPSLVYFDSDAFHRIGATFSAQGLADELRDKVLVSPITLLEVLSQLTLKRNAEILSHIHAVHNWVNPRRAGLLSWPSDAIARIGFLREPGPDDFIERVQKSLNVCLATDSADELRESAGTLKDTLDRMKQTTSIEFARLVDLWRKGPLNDEQFSEMWASGLAKRAKSSPSWRPIKEIVDSMSAYHEYEHSRLKTAAADFRYHPDDNDILDSEQLPYLGDEKLHFLTCDSG